MSAKQKGDLRSIAWLLAAPALLALGAGLVCAPGNCQPGAFDVLVLRLAAQAHASLADGLFRGLTWAGSILVLAPLALVQAGLAWRRLRHVRALFLPVALAGASLMAYAAKHLIGRERPAVAALIDMPADASFPSAHALQITAFVLAWLCAPGRVGPVGGMPSVLGGLAIVLVAWSRVHLQVHYPTDILFGLAAGAVWVLALRRLPIWTARA